MKSIIIAAVFCLTFFVSCGNSNSNAPPVGGMGHLYNACIYGNPKSLDPQIANDASSNTVISNLYSGLLKMDESGSIICDAAESYTISADGLTYTFILRQDNYWFNDLNGDEKADDDEFWSVIAYDYVFAFKRLFSPETHAPFANDYKCIKGSEDMLEGLPSILGVRANGDFELIFSLSYQNADFLNLLTRIPAKPCNERFFLSTKGKYGLYDDSVISNGAFFVRQWFYDPYGNRNILYMKRNAKNSEGDTVCPYYLSFAIERLSEESIVKQFKDGKIECMPSIKYDASYIKSKYYYSSYTTLTLGLIYNENDEIYSNKNLQKAIACAINKEALNKTLNSDLKLAYGIIPDGVSLLGRSYRELSSDKIFDCYSKSNALDYFEKAKEELGAESFNSVKILVNTDHSSADAIRTMSQQWQDLFGYYIGIEEVTADEYNEKLEDGEYSIALYAVTADYNSGVSFLKNFANDEYVNVTDEMNEDIKKLGNVGNSSDYVELFSSIEKKMLSECGFTPLFYKNVYILSKKESIDVAYDPFSGAVNYRKARYIG